MKTPEQQSELSKLRDEYQDSISTLIDEGWIRLGGSIEAYVEALEAKAISAAELVEKAELKAWISARDLQDFKDYQDEARNSSFSIGTFKTLNDDVELTISIVESEVGK